MPASRLPVAVYWSSVKWFRSSLITWHCHWYPRMKATPLRTYLCSVKRELWVWKNHLNILLDQGKICPSNSAAVAPILWFPEPHARGLQLNLDYLGQIALISMNLTLLHAIKELPDWIHFAMINTQIALQAEFNPSDWTKTIGGHQVYIW